MNTNDVGTMILDGAFRVHRQWGPGLIESVYEAALTADLRKQGLRVQRQVPVRLRIETEDFPEAFRLDLLVNGLVVVEIKSVERILLAHHKQLLTYLKLGGFPLGYLLNFREAFLKNGISRWINENHSQTPSQTNTGSP